MGFSWKQRLEESSREWKNGIARARQGFDPKRTGLEVEEDMVLGKIRRKPQIFPPKTNWRGGKIEAGGILYI